MNEPYFRWIWRVGSHLFQSFVLLVFLPYHLFIMTLRVRGRHHLRELRRKGFLLISNHLFYVEGVFIAHAVFPRYPYYLIMEQTFSRHPFFHFLLRLLRGVVLPKRRGIETLRETAVPLMRRGKVLHIFPEGKMLRYNQILQPFKKGAFLIALELGVPILPVTTVVVPRRFPFPGKRRIVMVIGRPLYPEEFTEEGLSLYERAGKMASRARKAMQRTIEVNRESEGERRAYPYSR